MEAQDPDRSQKILVAVDASNFEYVCIFAAASKWERTYPDEAAATLPENVWKADQDDLPELLNIDSFRRTLKFTVQDKLEKIREIITQNHMDEVDMAKDMDVFFAVDGDLSKNFRKQLYPAYKAQRANQRQRFSLKNMRPYIQDVLFKELGLESVFGYKIVSAEGCESDDVIATLMTQYPGYMKRILFSSDHDFLQLKDVVQYDCWGKKLERTIKDVTEGEVTRSEFLKWKIIRGDISDNIKNVFPKYGDKKSWDLVQDEPRLKQMLRESNDAMERFKLNSILIDFRRIPKEYTERMMKVIDAKLAEKKPGDFLLDDCMIV